MRWELSEEQEMFRESFSGWLDRFCGSESVRRWSDGGDPSEFEHKLVEEGWFSAGLPEEIGGQGGGLLELALTAEELGRHAAPSSAWISSVLAAPLLPTETAAEVLGGGGFAAIAADSSRAPDAPGAFRVSDDGCLTGAAAAVLGADRATRLVVPAHGADGLGLYLVDSETAGVSITPRELLDRTRSVADVELSEVVGRRLNLDAENALKDIALRAAVLVSADALGTMERMLELAVDYSKQRQQFGVPIGSFQAVKHAAAGILVSVEAGRSIAYYAAASVDLGLDDCALHAAVAKAQVTRNAVQAADSALVMHGAIGYTWEHDLHLYYKRAKLDEKLFGGPGVWNERLARDLPLLPAAG
ncbi:acyl-CoA dehydrogenase (plasmid) [Rhodococcus opacus]|uniref:acyl-CoA dehydrogenase family protein n=1 Tax=Rhodococcus opacus TaxID=37919 RepID=UPI0034D2BAF8